MNARFAARTILFGLVTLCVMPLILLALISIRSANTRSVEVCRIRGMRPFFGVVLERDALDRRSGIVRILHGDGELGPSALAVALDDLLDHRSAPSAWVFEREDGPNLYGVPKSILGPGFVTLRSDSLAMRLGSVPGRLREDRAMLVGEVRRATSDPAMFALVGEQWRRWLARDDSTRLVLINADGSTTTTRLSGILLAQPSPSGGAFEWISIQASQLVRFVSTPPGPWGGGGALPALLSVLELALFAGLFASVFGLSTAFWIDSWGRASGWRSGVRSLASHLAGVPGVVWGVVGAGILIHGLGTEIDKMGFVPGRAVSWGAGGLLWSSLTLGAFATPIVLSLALEELDRLPLRWRDLYWSSGATHWQVFRRLVLPASWRGLAASVLSGMARSAGETAPLFLTGAVRSAGGILVGGTTRIPGLSGGFLHPGVLALEPPWLGRDAELGQPLVALMLLCLALFCVSLDLFASRLRHRIPSTEEVLP